MDHSYIEGQNRIPGTEGESENSFWNNCATAMKLVENAEQVTYVFL